MTLFLGAPIGGGRLESESERASLRDAARLRKRVTIQSILVQSWPSWALNDHKEEMHHLRPWVRFIKLSQIAAADNCVTKIRKVADLRNFADTVEVAVRRRH